MLAWFTRGEGVTLTTLLRASPRGREAAPQMGSYGAHHALLSDRKGDREMVVGLLGKDSWLQLLLFSCLLLRS